MAAEITTTDKFAAIDAMFARRAAPVQPISAEQAAKTRAALDARFREGELVMNRDHLGQFTGAVRVATFGGAAPVEAVEPALALAAE